MVNRSLPTDAELAILRVLWRRGPSTVREVHEDLKPVQGTGYTTVLKLMQIMAQKGLVERDEAGKSHVYRAMIPEEQAQKGLVHDLVEKAFGGSASRLVLRALSAERASREELAEIRALLDDIEQKRSK
ncbi:BlaI/MecI/CopY family transcriptional regulator [Polyangium sp. 6x1]|uniref:BlaI/MecI/CopY family transcriptional regulator n=1 Tax=Polyangium sp. 6x1 TaxID=3042689 RepID=UPI00248323E1|nr:BlaI/MecI/CopY family transcriptional regulator [Polyangium sp. 6x1]MDI1442846.1 BlaI/MecI/CopY family transcriptional regulator [Polyangium sp. 6x1]